ncbi:MAG: hypothetical protein BGP15_20645 [Sphingobacterium sp. 40-24]|uniref:Uncharacterized protein n=1 Tax=Sphingobacterium multivorum TaxID=28454 RepID=A0A654BTQ4_SPHMU|nr:MAG: hypothetical protein BGP15_20645 [Sphingobacterium sp. 40-24]VXC83929.1 conserved hypothetical protein [Sphingobacterium multivorum]
MVAFGASFARVGSGVSAGLDSDSTRTQHGQNTVAGQICPEHGTKQVEMGAEGSRKPCAAAGALSTRRNPSLP